MEISQITLAVMLLYSFLFGIAVGILYDVNRIARVLFGVRYTKKAYSRLYSLRLPVSKKNVLIGSSKGFWQSLVINLGDALCVLVATVGAILINYGYNSGRFRFFTVAALIVGFVIYRFSIGRMLILVAEPLAFICKYIFLSICGILALPLRKFGTLIYKFVKKISSLYIFTLENKNKKLYNIREEVFLSDGVDKDTSSTDKNKRWRYKKGGSNGGNK
jgi:hypothetical protein